MCTYNEQQVANHDYIAISVGNSNWDILGVKIMGEDWNYWDVPRSQKIASLLEGLEVIGFDFGTLRTTQLIELS